MASARTAPTPEPFTVEVPQDRLDDLVMRLRRTRFPDDLSNEDWGYGVNGAYLADLVSYWAERFDWRAAEREINAYENFRVELDGIPLHYLRAPGRGPAPIPIVLAHGWPWTFWDFRDLIALLSDPAASGGDPADAFDVIVPSLPGYGFSTPLPRAGVTIWDAADLYATLMTDVLGYERFAAHGGDYGVMVMAQLGHKYADRLHGVHMAPRPLPLHMWNIDRPWADLMTGSIPDELGDRAGFLEWERRKIGHVVAHVVDPQTLAYALHDSPAGLAAWLLERRRTWSDCDGDVESVFSRDDLLTNFSLYWFTDSFVSSARLYQDNWRSGWEPSHDRQPVVEAPTGLTLFRKDLPPGASTDWMGEYFNVQFMNESPTGGHFAAVEEPERVADDLRTFFRRFR